MHKIIILLVLFIPAFVFAGGLEKKVTKSIINQADRATSVVVVTGVNEDDNAVFCTLLDDDGKVIASRRVFRFETFPCEALNTGEKEFIQGLTPSDSWDIEEIKLWLDSKQTKDEDGAVLKDDPYIYKQDAAKADLFLLVEDKEKL